MLFFHLKNSFRSQDIKIVVLTFYHVEKNGSTRKIRLIPKFMRSQRGKQTITMYILPNILQSKSRQAWGHNLGNKQLQCTYCPIFNKVKADRHEVATWETSNCNAHFDNISQDKYFCPKIMQMSKIMQKMSKGE